MRESKFRAWQQVTKIMFYNIEKGTGAPGGNPPFADYLENTRMIVMQYTGFKDKSGKEIYEGDIVRMFGWNELEQVMWCDNGFYVVTLNSEDASPQLIPHNHRGEADSLEVIGNGYEQPELMKT